MSGSLLARPAAALAGTAAIPGDKSCSHRALILAALADGETRISGLLESDDIMATARAVAALGADVEQDGPGEWRVRGGEWGAPAEPIACGNSGTSARLLMGAAAGFDLTATFTGDASLSARPMRRVIAPLERMGARFEGGERLPVTVHGQRLGGIEHRNDPASAQVKSAILLAGLRTAAAVRIVEPVPSRDHSEIMLGQFGCTVEVSESTEGRVVALGERRSLDPCELAIAADPSGAAFPLVAAAIVPGSAVRVRGMLVNPLRTGLYEALEEMGAAIRLSNERLQSGEIVADIEIGFAPLGPIHVAADRIPAMIDEIPILAVACAFADGESVIEGLAELRHKESDRLGAIVAGLAACGVAALVEDDTLRIFGRGEVRGGARVATQGDHRIAMAFLTLGLASRESVEIDRSEMIATSFPGFVDTMRGLGADIE